MKLILNIQEVENLILRQSLTLKTLAKLANIAESTLSQLLQGKTKPHTSTIGKLAKALGVDPTSIIIREVR